jgi:hypothetical protein
MKRPSLLISLTVLVTACGADVPDKPTWLGDVQPIVRANCARCHGADPTEEKLSRYRIDRSVAGDTATLDAFDKAGDIVAHAVDHEAPVMPPDYLLTERQQEILARWAAAGAPKGSRAGGNTLGHIELVSPLDVATADQSLDTMFRSWDDDLDGLVVALWVRDEAGENISVGTPVGGGLRELSIDAGTLASKHTFEVYAVVDDGYDDDPEVNKQHQVVLIPSVFVDHGIRGTAPRVELKTPNGGDTLVGSTTITWTATDPDPGDTLVIDLELVPAAGGTPIPIASGLANTQSFEWTIPASVPDRDTTGAPISYRVRVTATDTLGMPPNVRSDESDTSFTIERSVVTTYTWTANTRQIFADYCTKTCHDRSGTGSRPTMCLLQYQLGDDTSLCDATDQGAYENRLAILSELTAGTMPPRSAPSLPQDKRVILTNWIQGGAPYGTGGSDAAPSVSWTSPSGGHLVAAGGVAALAWSVSDDVGLASDRVTYRKLRMTNAASQCLNDCNGIGVQFDATTPSWLEITTGPLSGTSQQRTFDWSTPSQGAGCYCVEATVVDTTNHSTTVRAGNAVKF